MTEGTEETSLCYTSSIYCDWCPALASAQPHDVQWDLKVNSCCTCILTRSCAEKVCKTLRVQQIHHFHQCCFRKVFEILARNWHRHCMYSSVTFYVVYLCGFFHIFKKLLLWLFVYRDLCKIKLTGWKEMHFRNILYDLNGQSLYGRAF